ncbi:UvrD-helicase domain-containing protein [Nitrogeniibacter aestuarii]|uniref:UvrD-helicase domain-containing protein n=1 Tax=Nitrogeniibacter aestuarii TaxID=2815343 RepID=UPI001E467BED|nr:UvrD-helicase domain-containing protein [Nitrogeniibacter aestuarii]
MTSTEHFTATALDPARSVVVEACAGSGKTWLLVSRMLRILLDGARPGDILAITYTRKAAREIGERLHQWLRLLASESDDEVIAFLIARGLDEASARAALPRARRLIEVVEQASPGITMTTFHGWFARILGGASLSSGVAGYAMADAERPVLEEAWAVLSRQCEREPDGPVSTSLMALFGQFGRGNATRMLEQFVARRAEWSIYAQGASVDALLERWADEFGGDSDEAVLERFFATPGLTVDLLEYGRLLGLNTSKDVELARRLVDALAQERLSARFDAMVGVFLTTAGEPRIRKASAAQAKRLGEAGESDLLRLHAQMSERVLDCIGARVDVSVLAFNIDAVQAGSALLAAFDQIKRDRRVMDFTDLEVHVDRLLGDEAQGPYLQARLDARYRQILLDEFQDTNPVQWRILLSWLGAYDADAYRPSVFMVGDPKQSIYRFRRADARIFAYATEWLAREFGAVHLPNNHTWRNAPAIVEVVNAVFEHEPGFAGFEPQQARLRDREGMVKVMPLIEVEKTPQEADSVGTLRDPLTVPEAIAESLARSEEARSMVAQLSEWQGRLLVGEGEKRRPMGWGDVLILTRKRGILPEYERALREAGIPYLSVSRGQLLSTLEAADLCALLEFLIAPSHDLALVHVLRSPVFGVPDAFLMALAGVGSGHWWARLEILAAAGDPQSALAQRAHASLSSWIELARRLPVHDLLDRIYHEADLLRAYRARVPEAMWAGVCANLEAFLELALNVDGGRFPSLPRFVDELRRLGQAGDEEAPDEGRLAEQGSGGRVRIMTIHGAKGLEAPVVWMIDANNTKTQPDNYQPVMAWPVGASAPTHFSMHATKALQGRARAHIFEADEAAARREALNLLYVAITRAEQCFVVSGAKGRGTQTSDYVRIESALRQLGSERAHGALPALDVPVRVEASHEAEAATVEVTRPVGERLRLSPASEGMSFGTAMHAVLEARLSAGMSVPDDVPEAAIAAAEAILAAPDMQRWFDPGQHLQAWNEVEIMHPDGRLGRIDRLVLFEDELWVLDYKSGGMDEALAGSYRAQLQGYQQALGGLYGDRPVRAMLVFPDGTRHRV